MSTLAAAIAAHGLPNAHRLPDRPLDDHDFAALTERCTGQRVLGLLGLATRQGAFPVTPTQRDDLEQRWTAWLAHALRVEALVVDVLGRLDGEGIAALVLKGAALAHTAYPDPAARVFGDVDILVAPGRLHRAVEVLTDAFGATRAEPELRPGFDDRFAREAMVRVGAIEVDLHRTFVNGAYGVWADVASAVAAADRIHLAGQSVAVLSSTDRLLHAAYGSTLSDWPPRLVAYRDLAQMVVADAPPVAETLDRATAWRALPVLAAAVRDAWRVLRCTERPELLEWADRHHASAGHRALMAASRGRARGYTGQLTTVVALEGVGPRVAFLRAILTPSREYREARHLGRFGLVGAGATRARRG